MNELGSRERTQPAPPLIVWRSLIQPHEPAARPWLDLLDDEVEPTVVKSVEPELVVWTSLWPQNPDDTIRFDLRSAGAGTALRWTLTTPGDAPAQDRVNFLRHRLNVLVNERLRLSYGQ